MRLPRAGLDTRRNRLAYTLANAVFNLFATEDYRDFIAGTVQYGLDAAARDVIEGREPPRNWVDQIQEAAEQADPPPPSMN